MNHETWQALVENPFRPLENKAIQAEYPPASTYKIITAIAGLEEGVINDKTTFNCPGFYRYGNRIYRCWLHGGHGSVNVVEALASPVMCFSIRWEKQWAWTGWRNMQGIWDWALLRTWVWTGRQGAWSPTAEWKRRRLGTPGHPGRGGDLVRCHWPGI